MEKCEALSTKPEECRYSFFQHTACEFFPCHETAHPEDFNCLFCYCPLYALGDRCGGNFRYVGDGIKDCSACLLPHGRKSYRANRSTMFLSAVVPMDGSKICGYSPTM